MAIGSGRGKGRQKLPHGRDSNGSGVINTGLSVQPVAQQTSVRNPDLRNNGYFARVLASLPGDDEHSSDREGRENNVGRDVVHSGGLRAGGNGHGRDSEPVKQSSVQSAGQIERPKLSDVANGYREPSEGPNTAIAETRVCDGDEVLKSASDNATKLDRVTTMALDKEEEILGLPLPPIESPHFKNVLSAQQAAAGAVLTARLKADENYFRRRKQDVLDNLYAKLEKRGLVPPLLEQAAIQPDLQMAGPA